MTKCNHNSEIVVVTIVLLLLFVIVLQHVSLASPLSKVYFDNSNKGLATILITCDKYSFFSPACLLFLKNNVLPFINTDVYYTSESHPLVDNVVTNILTPNIEGKYFVDRLLHVLNHVKYKYIFLVQEDHWYTEPIHIFFKLMKICNIFNLHQLKFFPRASSDLDKRLATKRTDTIYKQGDLHIVWSGTANFPLSHHATIFDREYLISNLIAAKKHNMRNPWEHERFNFQFKNNMKEFHNDHKKILSNAMNFTSRQVQHVSSLACLARSMQFLS